MNTEITFEQIMSRVPACDAWLCHFQPATAVIATPHYIVEVIKADRRDPRRMTTATNALLREAAREAVAAAYGVPV